MLNDKSIIVDDIRIRGIGKSYDVVGESAHAEHQRRVKESGGFAPVSLDEKDVVVARRKVYFEGAGRVETPIVKLKSIKAGQGIVGPAILVDETQTIVVEPECEAHILASTVVLNILYDGQKGLVR